MHLNRRVDSCAETVDTGETEFPQPPAAGSLSMTPLEEVVFLVPFSSGR